MGSGVMKTKLIKLVDAFNTTCENGSLFTGWVIAGGIITLGVHPWVPIAITYTALTVWLLVFPAAVMRQYLKK